MNLNPTLRKAVFERDNYTCVYCGSHPQGRRLQADHVIPRSLGGQDLFENLVTSCQTCNVRKKARLLTFREMLSVAPDVRWDERYSQQGKVCSGCGGIVEYESDSFCSCRKEPEIYSCYSCGEEMDYDDYELCRRCRDDDDEDPLISLFPEASLKLFSPLRDGRGETRDD